MGDKREVKKLISAMLKEDTGTSPVDSGALYGRHWERNKDVDFENTPEVEIDASTLDEGDEIPVRINIYHMFVKNLGLDPLSRKFNQKFNKMGNWGRQPGLSDEAVKWLENSLSINFDKVYWYSSQNSNASFSQAFEYVVLGDYLLLRVHNGADLRMGWTNAKLFYLNDWVDEGVLGVVTYPNGDEIRVDTYWDGYTLTDETGKNILYQKDMEFDLWLPE